MKEFKKTDVLYHCSKIFVDKATNRIFGKRVISNKYKDRIIYEAELGNDEIYKMIQSGKPFMAGRFGGTESVALFEYIKYQVNLTNRPSKKSIKDLHFNAGFFPPTNKEVLKFGEMMQEYAKDIDILSLFKWPEEEYIVNRLAKQALLTRASAVEPFKFEHPWSRALKNKEVLVIHPFSETIKSQYEKREVLFKNKDTLPDFNLKVQKAVQTIAGNCDERFSSWFDALDYMTDEALKVDFDIALIGCGAYGLPLAARLKKSGKQAVHIGGGLQLLFGIKGGRWEGSPRVSKLFNEHWVYPSKKDKPNNFKKIEGGCYW